MPSTCIKHIKSKYKHVAGANVNGNIYWRISIKGVGKDSFKNERDAAKAADLYLIKIGKNPVNILKPTKSL